MNPLQKCKDHSSQQFGRLRSNRFGKNGLTDACRAAFSKQAAPRSHAFLSCHEAPPPGTCCGELRGGLSSRLSGVESLKHRSQQRRSRPAGSIGSRDGSYCRRPGSAGSWVRAADCKSAETTSASLLRMKSARSTEFPLRRLAVRGCERTMSGAKRRASMKRSGTSEADFRTAAPRKPLC